MLVVLTFVLELISGPGISFIAIVRCLDGVMVGCLAGIMVGCLDVWMGGGMVGWC